MGCYCLNEYRFSVLPDKESSGDGLHNHMNVLNTTELNLKMVKSVNFMLRVCYPPIKKKLNTDFNQINYFNQTTTVAPDKGEDVLLSLI